MVSCTGMEKTRLTVDADYWGEDVIFNESGQDLTMTLYGRDGETLSLMIPDGKSDTLDLPSMEYTLSISLSSDSLKIDFADGRQLLTKPSDELIYGTYELEQKTIYYEDAEVDKLWPTYRYHITENHSRLAVEVTENDGVIYPVEASEQVADFFKTYLVGYYTLGDDIGFSLGEKDECIVIDSMDEFKEIAPAGVELPEIDFENNTLIIGCMVAGAPCYSLENQVVYMESDKMTVRVTYSESGGPAPDIMVLYTFWALYDKLPDVEAELDLIIVSEV